MKKRNIFWGIFFILATVILISSQLVSFMQLNFWSVLATILLVAVIIQSCVHRVWIGLFLPLALLYMIYWHPLGLPDIAPWILIVAALLLTIAFHILFKSKPPVYYIHNRKAGINDSDGNVSENDDENHPVISVSLGAAVRYLRSNCLETADLKVSLGAIEVYFDHTTLSPSGAEVFLNCHLGAIKLFIPRNWPVINNTNGSMGGIEFKNTGLSAPDPSLPTLRLSGNVSMGGIEVVYI